MTKKKPGRHLMIYPMIGSAPSVVQTKKHSRRMIK